MRKKQSNTRENNLAVYSAMEVKRISPSSAQSSMEVRVTMVDLFQHGYYKWNKILLTFIGQWPYRSTRDRVLMFSLIMVYASTAMIPQIMAVVNNLDNIDLVMESAVSLLFCGFCLTKYFYFVYNSKKMLKLFNHMQTDWQIWGGDCDEYILHPYAQRARRATILCTVIGCSTSTLFVMQPVVPKIIDVLLNNGTNPGQFPVPLDYCFIDMQKYYFFIILHFYVYASVGFIGSTKYDSMYIVHVLHGCGIFAALGRKLERIVNNERSAYPGKNMEGLEKRETDFQKLKSCVELHKDAIEYAELVEATYSWCFFVMMGLNMLQISLTGLQVMKKTTHTDEKIRFTASTFVAMLLLLVDNNMGQLLMDHSISIRYHILNGNWYELPLNTQKFLLFMLMRCNIPCKLTIGKVFILSVENFTALIKTSMSYLTVLRSM